MQRMLRSGGSAQAVMIARRAKAPGELGAPPQVREEVARSLRQIWTVDVLGPISETFDLLKTEAPTRDDLSSACEKIGGVARKIRALIDSAQVESTVTLHMWRVYMLVTMVERGLQPYGGASAEFGRLVTEAEFASSEADELQKDVPPGVAPWSAEVATPIAEAAGTIKGDSTTKADLLAAREKLFAASRKIRALAAGEDLDPYVQEKLWRLYMQVTMLERGLYPYAGGATTELARIRGEAGAAADFAGEIAEKLP